MRPFFASCLVFALSLSSLSARAQDVRLDPELAELHASAERPAPQDAGARVFAQLAVSVATVGMGALVGGLIGSVTAPPCPEDAWLCLGPTIQGMAGASIGFGLASALAPVLVDGVGGAFGGRGDLGAAYLGFLVGAASAALTIGIGAGVYGLTDSGDGGDAVLIGSVISGAALVIVGPVVGYEIGHGRAVRSPVTPGVAVGPNGGSLTLAGAF